MTTTLERTEERHNAQRFPSLSDKRGLWARRCATLGAVVWAGTAVAARAGVARIGAIELMFLFAPLVIVPLGMELGRVIGGTGRLDEMARWVQPFGAAAALVALLLPPGRWAGLLACGWMIVCLLMAGAGVVDLLPSSGSEAGRSARSTHSQTTLASFVVGIARIDLVVGGSWLVASRLGMRPLGIQEPIGLLTAVHFHFAGFSTAMIAAATLRFGERRQTVRWLKWLLPLVVAMPYVVAIGFVISPVVKMVAAILFSVSVAGLAVALRSCGRRAERRAAQVLLQVAAAAVFAGMVLSGVYAVADFVGSDVLTIPQMARTHGILNAVGFCMAGTLGWLVESADSR